MIKIHNSIYTNIDNILRYRNFMIFIFLSFFQDGVRKTRMLCHIKKVVARIFHYLSYYLKNMTYYRAISFPLCQNHFLFFSFEFERASIFVASLQRNETDARVTCREENKEARLVRAVRAHRRLLRRRRGRIREKD